jgi:YggT family protein
MMLLAAPSRGLGAMRSTARASARPRAAAVATALRRRSSPVRPSSAPTAAVAPPAGGDGVARPPPTSSEPSILLPYTTAVAAATLPLALLLGAAPPALAIATAADPAAADAALAALPAAQLEAFLRPFLTVATLLCIVRIPMTWYPSLDGKKLPWALAYAPTEPVLAATRRVVPPVGGVDVTPIVWVALLSFASEILLGPQGLLILVQRQQAAMMAAASGVGDGGAGLF